MAEINGDVEESVEGGNEGMSVLPAKQPQTLSEAIDYANGAYGAALADAEGIDPAEALKALKFFAYVGRFAANSVVGGRIKRTGFRQIELWGNAVRGLLSTGGPTTVECIGIDLVGLDVLETAAANKRTDMSHAGSGGYRFLADGAGVRPHAALGRIEAANKWGREIGAGDVHRSVSDRVDDALIGGSTRKSGDQ